jgi:spore cortex formation protein SpoVR/YcgB (stage V sporulation)
MQPDYMEATLKNMQSIWRRPVSLATMMDGEGKVYTHDGKEMVSTNFSELPKGEV